MRGERLSRHWRIIQLLTKRRAGIRAAELESEFEASGRTLYRDLQVLQAAGFPLYTEQEGRESRWKLLDTFSNNIPIFFSPDELMALEVARGLLQPLTGTIVEKAAKSAFDKIRATLPDGVCEFLDGFRGSFGTAPGPVHDYGQMAAVVAALQEALKDRRTVQFGYHAFSTGEDSRREVDPYGLYFHAGTLYLVGHCHLRGELRLFTVDRIHKLTTSDARFERPDDFALDKFMGSAFGAFVGKTQQVRLRFAPGAARYVRERVWHASQKISLLSNGACRLELSIPISGEIESWILSWGADCQVEAPKALRQRICAAHRAACKANV
jgi:predicted DNA-binding transcriptional regulator YafY